MGDVRRRLEGATQATECAPAARTRPSGSCHSLNCLRFTYKKLPCVGVWLGSMMVEVPGLFGQKFWKKSHAREVF